MKIFSMNDCEWMAAETLEEAKVAYLEQTGEDEDLLDDPGEIAESQYDKLMFRDDDGSRTFRQQLDLMIARGEKFPTFFASTEY